MLVALVPPCHQCFVRWTGMDWLTLPLSTSMGSLKVVCWHHRANQRIYALKGANTIGFFGFMIAEWDRWDLNPRSPGLSRWPAVLRPVAHDLPCLVCGKEVHIPTLKSPAQSHDVLWWIVAPPG